MTPSLADRLKQSTRQLHTEAERSPFMAVLLRGGMDKPGYAALLLNLHAIYAPLEAALARHATHPAIAPVLLPGLPRTQALLDDLATLPGPPRALQPASEHYARRLLEIDTVRPELLLSHAYVRYLGDLSGGQLLARIVSNSKHLAPGIGTAFYDFGDGDAAKRLARDFRIGLDKAPLDEAAATAVIDEACLAFKLHRRLFDELARACLPAHGGRS